MYFPNTIVFTRVGSIAAVARSGGASTTIVGGGRAQRSPNGLVVSSSQGDVRPDGASVARIGGRTTLTAWGNDGRLAYWGVGNQLYSTSNGGSAPITDIFGDLISVSFSPDGSTLLFASRDQVRRIMGDGAIITTWDSGGDSIVDGPYWALRNGNWGIYVRLASGRRVFMGEGGGDISDPFEHLQLASPASEAGRVYVRTDNGGSLTLVAVWPGAADFEFTAPSLQDVSWSPDGPQLVYASTGGELVLLDVSTGASQVLTGGGVRYPIWSSPRYLVRN
jgi:WD40 repeat protein